MRREVVGALPPARQAGVGALRGLRFPHWSNVGIAQSRKHSDSFTIAVSHAPASSQPNFPSGSTASSRTASRNDRRRALRKLELLVRVDVAAHAVGAQLLDRAGPRGRHEHAVDARDSGSWRLRPTTWPASGPAPRGCCTRGRANGRAPRSRPPPTGSRPAATRASCRSPPRRRNRVGGVPPARSGSSSRSCGACS